MLLSKIQTISKSIQARKTQDFILAFVIFGLVILAFNSAFKSEPKECKRYCQAKAPLQTLPSEQEYFSGIDNYAERFPERLAKYRELKSKENR